MGCLRDSCKCGNAAFRLRCVDWVPPRRHRYATCLQFIESRTLCDLPRSACRECPLLVRVARLPASLAELRRKRAAHRATMREYMRRRREIDRLAAKEARRQFLGDRA